MATYADSFGLQWNAFRKTQLDSHTGLPISEQRLKRCLGPVWDSLSTMTVLECGCGAGRFTEVLLRQGAHVHSVDLSEAVVANKANCPISERHAVMRADVNALPFSSRFDLVMCLGVVQHTRSPEKTIADLYAAVRPGGYLVFDHYAPSVTRWLTLKPLYRAYLRRQDPRRAMQLIKNAVTRFYPWHARFRDRPLAWTLLSRVSPLTTYLKSIPELPEHLQREWCELDTFDSLTDFFKHLRTKEQIEGILRGCRAEEIASWEAGNGIEARCRKPLQEPGERPLRAAGVSLR
jgi:SAM-dependent methyltransferase